MLEYKSLFSHLAASSLGVICRTGKITPLSTLHSLGFMMSEVDLSVFWKTSVAGR